LRVALVYDRMLGGPPSADLPEDWDAEYEDAPTIAALLSAISACGHEAVGIAFGEDFPAQVRRAQPDLVLNTAEGVRGPARESIVPAWLDHLGIPYAGSDGLVLALTLDKALTKTILATRGIHTPRFRRVADLRELDGLDLAFPLFVKPNSEGSSMGIRATSVVGTPEELARQVAWVLSTYKEDCLVEEFAPGREFCVGMLGNEDLEVFPIVEVRKPADRPYDDVGKPRKELLDPADLPEQTAQEMRSAAVEAFRTLRCRDLARVDFRLDAAGRPAFLEINPLPGLSPFYSIYPYQAKMAGLSHEELIGRIVEVALQRVRHAAGRS
jgi:D-alanine-D-alanine ligase